MAKILTNRGVEKLPEGVDSVETIEIQPKKDPACPPQVQNNIYPPEIKKEVIKNFNEKPPARDNHIRATDEETHFIINKTFVYISIIAVLVMILGFGIWSNLSFQGKSFASNITTNVLPADVSVPVNVQVNSTNNNQIYVQPNMTISLPQQLTDVLTKVLNQSLNSS